jgi:putative ATPase
MPLALRMTPSSLDELTGQKDILDKGKLLRRAIEADKLSSVILYGPPGTGKSALARIIAAKTSSHFIETNAVTIGVGEIRKIIADAKLRLENNAQRTTLLLDEIHHFNRTQQDALLPDVEKGVITLVGITTENPYFYVNSALISRSILFEFKPLSDRDLETIIDKALSDKEKGLGSLSVKMTGDAKAHLIKQANGDARRLLNGLEIGVYSTSAGADGIISFTLDVAEQSMQRKQILYDKRSDEHYDHISAFIKSMRGSDPDAAVYWMAKMLIAGEDPRFIARRLIIFSAEDVGNADPNALVVATAALQAIEFVGMPEAKIPLGQAVVYAATAPKSNASYAAIRAAEKEVAENAVRPVPDHLKDGNLDGQGKRGHGVGYKYPHDFPGHFVEQDYMPEHKIFYSPSDQGYEVKIGERLANWRSKKKTEKNDTQTKK